MLKLGRCVVIACVWIGVGCKAAPPSETPPPSSGKVASDSSAPRVVAPSTLEALRVSGQKEVTPDAEELKSLSDRGLSKLITTYKICVDTAGRIAATAMLRPSGIASYDVKVRAALQTWNFRPFLVDSVASSVCTSATFVYDAAKTASL
jgi:hypothetical protein